MKNSTQLYANCMEEVRDRVNLVKFLGEHHMTTGREEFDVELVFLHLRKVLELIAFASLTANKEKYSVAHARFATHWKAKLLLQELENVNPDFYPMPIERPQAQANGVKHCRLVSDGFLTKEDFIFLYDKASDVIHVRNPFDIRDPRLNIRYSVKEWVSRIEVLLGLHVVHLVDDKKWIVQIPSSGPVWLYTAEPYVTAGASLSAP